MKKILLIVAFVVFFVGAFSQSNIPIVVRTTGTSIPKDARLMAGLNFYNPAYNDTTTANILANIGIDSCGATIYVRGSGIWYRECSPKRWIQLASAGSIANIYNSNGTITSNRTVDGGGKNLDFNNVANFSVTGGSTALLNADDITLTGSRLFMNGFTAGSTATDSILVRRSTGQLYAIDVSRITNSIDLQQVTDNGNITTNPIIIDGSILQFKEFGFFGRIGFGGLLSADRDIDFPDKSGTVALTSDLTGFFNTRGYGITGTGQIVALDTTIALYKSDFSKKQSGDFWSGGKAVFGSPIAAYQPGGAGMDRAMFIVGSDSTNPADKQEAVKIMLRTQFNTVAPIVNFSSEAINVGHFIGSGNTQGYSDVNVASNRVVYAYSQVEAGASGNIPVGGIYYARFQNDGAVTYGNTHMLELKYQNSPKATVSGAIKLDNISTFTSNSVGIFNGQDDAVKFPQRGHFFLYDSLHLANWLGSIFSTQITTSGLDNYLTNINGSLTSLSKPTKGYVDSVLSAAIAGYVPTSRTLTGGYGINSIGNLSADRTISVDTTSIQNKLSAGTGIAISGNTIYNTATASGTVTSFSFTDGSGFDGTITNSTTTPTLALTTTLTNGIVPRIITAGAMADGVIRDDGTNIAVGNATISNNKVYIGSGSTILSGIQLIQAVENYTNPAAAPFGFVSAPRVAYTSGSSSLALTAFYAAPTVLNTNTQNLTQTNIGVTGYYSNPTSQSGGTGTITNSFAFKAIPSYAGATATNYVGMYSANPNTAQTITNMAGVFVNDMTRGSTMNVNILTGTTSTGSVISGWPTGNYNIYSATAYNNYFGTGNSGFGGTTSPTAYVHTGAGTATAGTAPFKLTAGTVNTTAEVGAWEFSTGTFWASPIAADRRPVSLGGRNVQSGTTYTVVAGDQGKIIGLTNVAARTITLCAASAVPAGTILWFKDEAGTATTANITINRAGSDLIDGGTSTTIILNYGAKGLYSDSVNWFVI